MDLKLTPYHVVATSPIDGMVEFVPSDGVGDIVKVGTRVVINQEVEPEYPVNAILTRRELEEADTAQKPEPEELWYTTEEG